LASGGKEVAFQETKTLVMSAEGVTEKKGVKEGQGGGGKRRVKSLLQWKEREERKR